METLAVSSSFSLSTLRRLRRRPSPAPFPSTAVSIPGASVRLSGQRRSSSTFSALAPPSAAAAAAAIAEKEEAAEFAEACKNGNLVPLYRSIFCDHLTPVLAYRCLVKEDDRDAPSFLFESVEQGSRGTNVGRYSVIGAQPAMEIVAKENLVSIMDHEEGTRTEELVEDPMEIPRMMMEGWSPQCVDEFPDAFSDWSSSI